MLNNSYIIYITEINNNQLHIKCKLKNKCTIKLEIKILP